MSPDIPPREQGLTRTLKDHFRSDMSPEAIEQFCRERGHRLEGKPEAEVVRYVA